MGRPAADLPADEGRSLREQLAGLHAGQSGLQSGVLLQRAELDHLREHVLVAHRVQRILRRHLRDQQSDEIILPHQLGRLRADLFDAVVRTFRGAVRGGDLHKFLQAQDSQPRGAAGRALAVVLGTRVRLGAKPANASAGANDS